jgi:hypothetical protein
MCASCDKRVGDAFMVLSFIAHVTGHSTEMKCVFEAAAKPVRALTDIMGKSARLSVIDAYGHTMNLNKAHSHAHIWLDLCMLANQVAIVFF